MNVNMDEFYEAKTDLEETIEFQEKNLDRMRQGVSKFGFTKKDGTTKTAYGTLNPALIPPATQDQYNELMQAFNTQARVLWNMECPDSHVAPTQDELDAANKLATKLFITPKKERAQSGTVQNYYDVMEGAWKSYVIENLLVLHDL